MNDSTLRNFVNTFVFLQKFNCLEAIDAMFLKMINEDWSAESVETNKTLIVTFCRINFKIKDNLYFYEPFVDKSVKYLEEHGLNPAHILSGIVS